MNKGVTPIWGHPFFLAYMPDYHYLCLALSNIILKR